MGGRDLGMHGSYSVIKKLLDLHELHKQEKLVKTEKSWDLGELSHFARHPGRSLSQ